MRSFLLLLVVLVTGMWWLSTFQYSMKWDMMDITLPWNHYISESLRAGELPLWNPYLKNGFPMMGLPDTWYPITWIISFLFGMDVWSIQIDYLLHLFIGGYGMLTYARVKGIDPNYSLAIGVCYMFSGFMVGNAQHLGWIIGAAWLPWVLYYFENVIRGASKAGVLKLAMVSGLLFYGAYPPITIIIFYILLAKLGYGFFKKRKVRNREAVFKIGLSFLLFLLVSAVGLLGLIDLAPHLNRGGQLPLSNTGWGVLTGYLPAQALSSFVIPYAGTSAVGFWGSDISLINCYCGFLPMLVMLAGLLTKHKKTWCYFSVGVLFLMIAMSEMFPLRTWLYYLPMFDRFRFPSLFRLFSIFFFLLASGFAFTDLNKTKRRDKSIKIVLGMVMMVLVVLTFYSLSQAEASVLTVLFINGLKSFNKVASFYDKATINFLILAVLIGSLFLFSMLDKKWLRYLGFFMVAEVLLISQFNISETVIHFSDPEVGNKEIQKYKGQGINIVLAEAMNTFDDGYWSKELTWFRFNQASITKTPSASGNSPFSLIKAKEAKANGDSALNNYPLFFFSDIENKKIVEASIDKKSHNRISVTKANHNEVVLLLSCERATNLIFMQNTYPGWEATIDGNSIEIETANTTFMSIPLSVGEQEVQFSFKPQKMIVTFWISLISFWLILVGIVWYQFKKELQPNPQEPPLSRSAH